MNVFYKIIKGTTFTFLYLLKIHNKSKQQMVFHTSNKEKYSYVTLFLRVYCRVCIVIDIFLIDLLTCLCSLQVILQATKHKFVEKQQEKAKELDELMKATEAHAVSHETLYKRSIKRIVRVKPQVVSSPASIFSLS